MQTSIGKQLERLHRVLSNLCLVSKLMEGEDFRSVVNIAERRLVKAYI